MKRPLTRAACAVVVLAALGSQGCQSGGLMGDAARRAGSLWSGVSVKMSAAQLVASAPYLGGAGLGSLSWGHCTHPYLVRLGSNRLFLGYCIVGDAQDGKAGVASADWPAWSEDGGATWTVGRNPFVWVDGVPKHMVEARVGQDIIWHSGYRCGQVETPQGVVVAYEAPLRFTAGYGVISEQTTRGIWTRDGVAIHGPQDIKFYAPTRLAGAWMNARGLVLADGSLMVTVYGTIDKERRASGFFSLLAFKSTDGGRTFGYLSTIGTPEQVPWGTEGPDEADVVRLQDGALLCVARTGPGGTAAEGRAGMLVARSEDDGLTWTRTDLGIQGVSPRLVRMQNGVVALAYGRPDLNMVFSEDQGRTWRKKIKVNRYGEMSTGYLDLFEVAPNRLLIVYDLQGVTHQGRKLNGIFSQFVDVEYEAPASKQP